MVGIGNCINAFSSFKPFLSSIKYVGTLFDLSLHGAHSLPLCTPLHFWVVYLIAQGHAAEDKAHTVTVTEHVSRIYAINLVALFCPFANLPGLCSWLNLLSAALSFQITILIIYSFEDDFKDSVDGREF